MCLGLNSWSKVLNELIISVLVTTEGNQFYMVDINDTYHTADYLVKVGMTSIDKDQSDLGCLVGSIVTYNTPNVAA